MSKTKSDIDDARDFAEQHPDEAPSADPVPAPVDAVMSENVVQAGRRVEVKMGGKMCEFYASEQQQINIALKEAVEVAERAFVDVCEAHEARVEACRTDTQAVTLRRDERMNELVTGYEWPQLAPVSSAGVSELCALTGDPAAVVDASDNHTAVSEQLRVTEKDVLDKMYQPVNLRATMAEYGVELTSVSDALLPHTEGVVGLGTDVIVPLHDLAFAKQFAVLRAELKSVEKKLEPLQQELRRTTDAKNDAFTIGDIAALESCAFREIDLQEQVMTLQRARLDAVFDANQDAANFLNNVDELRELTEGQMRLHRAGVDDRLAVIATDMQVLADITVAEQQRDESAAAAFKEEMQINAENTVSIVRKQRDVWDQIAALVAEHGRLAGDHSTLATQRVELHGANQKRMGEFDALSAGLVRHGERLEAFKASVELANKWLDHVDRFVLQMNATIDAKDVDGEALAMRHKEQLEYLRLYTGFKRAVDELTHRKETRSVAIKRMIRANELQISEAATTLDPNRAKYEAELPGLDAEQTRVRDQVKELAARAVQQRKLWHPTEEMLEDDGIDFEPPELMAEKERCARKTETLSLTRAFVSAEQETVDRDVMVLRKLKTTTKVAADGFAKRRGEKQAANAEAEERADSPNRDPAVME
jgi:hypothetical protein